MNDTLGWVYYKRNMAALAVAPLKKSVERVPNNATYRYHLGLAYAKTGEPQKAREMLTEALKLEPNSPSCRGGQARARRSERRHQMINRWARAHASRCSCSQVVPAPSRARPSS